jgi:hypothetical protein
MRPARPIEGPSHVFNAAEETPCLKSHYAHQRGHAGFILPDVGKASRWLCEAFGFELRLMIANHRAQLTGHPLSWSASMMYRSGTA